MAEPLAAASSGMAAPERDILLATKLHMPAPRPGVVPRPRLAEQLNEALACGLLLVCAPAGYGKTVLLADWARRTEQPSAWLSLDPGDNDPARFWRYAVAALDRARPGIGCRVAPLLGPPAPSSFEDLVTTLINELAVRQEAEQALLVFDDYHVIGSRPVHDSLGFLLEHRPAGLCVVLASRSDPPLALARLRARGQLAEVRAAGLRFTGDEAAALLRQSEQLRTFLLETSVLERLSGPLCDAVTGRTGSQALLEQVERAGLFVVPLDEVRGWWRYHHLFADLLRGRLLRLGSARVRELHRNAAAWCEEHGLADDAIRHAVTAGEMTRAARLIERHFDAVYYWRSEGATIRRWVSSLPADLARSRPRLLLVQALMAATGGDLGAVEPLLGAAERAVAGAAEEPFEPTAGPAGSMLVNVPALIALHRSYLAQLRGDAESTAAFAQRVLAELGGGEQLVESLAQWNLAVAGWLRGQLVAAERAFASSIAAWRTVGQRTLAAYGGYQLSQVQRAQGRLDAAARTCRQALEFAAPPGRPAPPTAGPAHVGLAEVAYQRNELDTALRLVTEGIALCRRFVYTAPLAAGLVTLAWIRQAMGDPAGARNAMREAGDASPGPAGPLNPVPAQQARLLLAQGDVAGAARWAQQEGLGAQDEPDYPREPGHLVLARVLLAQDQPGPALGLLDRLHAAAAAQDRVGSLIEVGALRALALAAGGKATAVTALAGTLMLACPEGHVRMFADEGPPMAALLGQLLTVQRAGQAAGTVPFGYLARLQRAFSAGPPASEPGRDPIAVPGIVDPLTRRELEILTMLAAGRSNRAIADELVVTLDTVKKHVGHVLGKLGAANRTEAVARARELSLIR